MAAIDKIYGTKEQYDELRAYIAKTRPEALVYFYEWHGGDDGLTHQMTNFPEEIDMWLLESCPLGWVVEYVRDQYGLQATKGE